MAAAKCDGAREAIALYEGTLRFRAYGEWKGVPAQTGSLASSFSNLRLDFTAPVADEGQPGLTTPEELLLGAAITAWINAFMNLARQMVLDVADIAVEGELIRTFDEIEGHQITAIQLQPTVTLRTGVGFEKVHDMFRRAVARAEQQSPVLRTLKGAVRIQVDATYQEAR